MGAQLSLNEISALSALLPILAAARNFRNLDGILRTAAAFFLIAAFFELALIFTIRAEIPNNMPMLHLFIAISVSFFSRIYYRAFSTPLLRTVVMVLGTAAFLLVLVNASFLQGIWIYPSLSNTVQSIIMITFSLLYFYQIFTRQEYIHIEKQGLFWINSGVLIYFSINIFLFMLFNLVIANQRQELYAIHSVTNIISNILYAIGLLCKPQKTT